MKILGINLDENKLPRHIGIIMDGNGRWAKKRGLSRIFGHRAGAKNVRNIIEFSMKLGIKCLSLFAFSTENWHRPEKEVNELFKLLRHYIGLEKENFKKSNIKLVISGDLSRLDEQTQHMLKNLVKELENNTGMILNLCINYSGRQEIIYAVNKILNSGIKKITEQEFERYLYTKDLPELDLLIRTSGELRISNFMLWQLAYTELYFTKTLWPDFSPKELVLAIRDFQTRERRFGRVSEY